MAQAGGTYLERYVESTAPLPAELQRLLTTLGELDQRISDLRVETRAKFEHCMDLPPLSARQAADADAEVTRLRREIEDAHKLLAQLSTEKLRLTATCSELVSGHISTLENELAIFSDEIVVRAREMEREALAAQTARSEQAQHTMTMGGAPMNAYGGAQQPASAMLQHAYMPPPQASRQQHSMYGGYPDVGGSHHQQVPPSIMPPPPQPGHHQVHVHAAAAVLPRAPRENHGHSRKPRQPQPGDLVAANVAEPPGETWIITTFMGVSAAGGHYEVQDDEAEPNTVNRYFLEAHNVLLMPRSASCRDEKPQPQGSMVLGVYPGTTTFYRAIVVAAPKRTPAQEWDMYTLQFEDDDQGAEPGAPLGRLVDFKHVVPLPQ